MLTDRQLQKLRALCRSEAELSAFGRGLQDACADDLASIDDLRRTVANLKAKAGNYMRADQREHYARELERLEQRIALLTTTREERMARVGEVQRIRNSISSTVDAVLRHAHTTRRELELDYHCSDETERSLLGGGFAA